MQPLPPKRKLKDITYASLSPLPDEDDMKNDRRSGPRKSFNVSEMDLKESLIKVEEGGKNGEAVKLKQLFPNKSYSNLAAIVGNPCYNMWKPENRHQNGGMHIPMTKPKVNTRLNLVSQKQVQAICILKDISILLFLF